MKNNSLYLLGSHLPTLRRKPRSTAHKLADSLEHIRRHSISSLGECFNRFIPSRVLENGDAGVVTNQCVVTQGVNSLEYIVQRVTVSDLTGIATQHSGVSGKIAFLLSIHGP